MSSVREEWRPVACEFEGWPYRVSNFGRVSSDRRAGKLISLSFDQDGYAKCTLQRNGVQKCPKVHRLVAMAFVPGYQPHLIINHRNCIKTDNRPENLEWVTHKQNRDHAKAMGRYDAHFQRRKKLTPEQESLVVRAVRVKRLPTRFLGRWFGCDITTIRSICDRAKSA